MKILHIFLVCFVCVYIKQISSKSCNNIPQVHSDWFLQCQPPCACPSPLSNFCVMDDERECIGCATNGYISNCLCAGDHCRCSNGERYCNNYCVAREEICDGKCQGDDRVCNGRCIPQGTTCHGCGEGQWKCNGVCIAEYQACNQKCNEALGYWMCGSHCRKGEQDRWESNGSNCERKSTNNNGNRSGRILEFLPCSENEWECGNKCIKRWEPCNGVCNAAKGDWKCGSLCKNQEEQGVWITDGKYCKTIQGNEIKATPEILVTSTTMEATTIEDIKLPSSISIRWIIFMTLCGVLSFSLTCVVLHAIFTCHKYRESEKEENNETPTLIWIVGHIPMYCSGRMQAQINKERDDEEINKAEIEVNEAYGEAYDEEYEENEVVDYNEYYA